jgi:hypothetical protein
MGNICEEESAEICPNPYTTRINDLFRRFQVAGVEFESMTCWLRVLLLKRKKKPLSQVVLDFIKRFRTYNSENMRLMRNFIK